MNRNVILIIVAVVLAACCCLCLALAAGGGLVWYSTRNALSTEIGPVLTEVGPALTQAAYTPTPTKVPVLVRTPIPTPVGGGADTLTTLNQDPVPASDLRDLALRLKGLKDVPQVVSTTPANYQVGDAVDFSVNNQDTRQYFTVTAKLAYETLNAYFFVEDGVTANQADIKKLVDTFQSKIYPTDREFFGSEWMPGIDGDPHLYILYAQNLGANVGGYFDSVSEYSRLAHPYSNEKEMFVLQATPLLPLSAAYWYSTLAHEFQHMIHWHNDPNEELWMNEGASMLAEDINGYTVNGEDQAFLSHPDLQLNTWADLSVNTNDAVAHYGAAYLFMKYFLDRFGEQATKALVADQANGLRAVDHTLASLGMTDTATGKTITAPDVFADWTIANYLNNANIGDGRYAYKGYTQHVPRPTTTVRTCPQSAVQATVRQFGTDYIDVRCTGAVTISFTGSQQASVVPVAPHSGRYAFWSNRGDESDMTLTHAFDLSGATSATLDYWAWWQIEQNYDFAYVEVSTDGGQTWQTLKTPSGTDNNSSGSNLGIGYTGCSGSADDPARGCTGDWVEEKVDLSAYAGKKIQVRFEYVTDAGMNYASFMVDDIAIPELNSHCDFEQDACGWDAKGFARIDNLLPQTFRVEVIHQTQGQTTVTPLPLDAGNQGSLTLNLQSGDKTILVVSGTTPYSTEDASYQYEIR